VTSGPGRRHSPGRRLPEHHSPPETSGHAVQRRLSARCPCRGACSHPPESLGRSRGPLRNPDAAPHEPLGVRPRAETGRSHRLHEPVGRPRCPAPPARRRSRESLGVRPRADTRRSHRLHEPVGRSPRRRAPARRQPRELRRRSVSPERRRPRQPFELRPHRGPVPLAWRPATGRSCQIASRRFAALCSTDVRRRGHANRLAPALLVAMRRSCPTHRLHLRRHSPESPADVNEGRPDAPAALVRSCVRRRPTLPRSGPRSTIGAERLSFRVRDGTGRFPLAMVAETLLRYLARAAARFT
jgi:hypothetical protein